MAFPETERAYLLKNKNYQVFLTITLNWLQERPIICVFDTGTGSDITADVWRPACFEVSVNEIYQTFAVHPTPS